MPAICQGLDRRSAAHPPGSSIDLVSFPPAAAQQYPRGMKEREPERPLKIVSVGDPVVESDAVA